MEYKKDVRTKNLTLRDVHVGDWVQVWSEITERYSPPLKIIQICDDGTIYLVTSDEERPTPWEENIKNVDALPITPELLIGFGFNVTENIDKISKDSYPYLVGYKSEYIGKLVKNPITGTYELYDPLFGRCTFVTDLYEVLAMSFIDIKLEWKGIE